MGEERIGEVWSLAWRPVLLYSYDARQREYQVGGGWTVSEDDLQQWERLAPAPAAGQRWEKAGRYVDIIAVADMIAVRQGSLPPWSSAVKCARWLLHNGYAYAGTGDPVPTTAASSTPGDAGSALDARAAAREMVDRRIRALAGQPFAGAIARVLRAASERLVIGPAEADALVAACREWEQRRSEVAPARRTLTPDQAEACALAAVSSTSFVVDVVVALYERSRSL